MFLKKVISRLTQIDISNLHMKTNLSENFYMLDVGVGIEASTHRNCL